MKVALAPTLEKFVSKKVKAGTYLDASDVIRESLRRWKEQEEPGERPRIGSSRKFRRGLIAPICQAARAFGAIFARSFKGNTRTVRAADELLRQGARPARHLKSHWRYIARDNLPATN